MKRTFFLLSILTIANLFVGCNNEDGIIIDPIEEEAQPETRVFFQGQNLFYEGQVTPSETEETKGARIQIKNPAGGLAWPKHTDEGWESARFSIRADGTIPDFYDKSSALYYGRPAGKSGVTSRNIGKVSTLFPYSLYDDRGLDYYKVDKKTGNNVGLFRYMYDTEGLKTQPAILEAPSVVEILADEADDLKAANKQAELDKVNALIAKGADYLDSHVLWYVVKEVAGQYRWHVNGVIRDVETPEYVISHIPDNVEVDVHQQVHQNWNEIKTSIHVRTDCSSVKVIIPLKEEDILENDDFAIRVYDFYYQEYTVKHKITHDANGIIIEITDIPASLIEQCKADFGDGITIEVHSYCTKDVWDDLKRSRVQTGKPIGEIKGQITSALRPGEEFPIYVEKSN